MIPNGKEIIIDGHKVVFESEPSDCRGCFFENRDSCPDCDEGIWVEEGSPWHTGTPTEEGWYLIKYKHNGGIRYIAMENPSKWVFINDDTLRWQKIEETD